MVGPCLMAMKAAGHFHVPLRALLIEKTLCDTINFTSQLSTLCESVSKLPPEAG